MWKLGWAALSCAAWVGAAHAQSNDWATSATASATVQASGQDGSHRAAECTGANASTDVCGANASISPSKTNSNVSASAEGTDYAGAPYQGHGSAGVSALADLASAEVHLGSIAAVDGLYYPSTYTNAGASLSDWLHFSLDPAGGPVPVTLVATLTGTFSGQTSGNPLGWGFNANDRSTLLYGTEGLYGASQGDTRVEDTNVVYSNQNGDMSVFTPNQMIGTFLVDPARPDVSLSLYLTYYGFASGGQSSGSDLFATLRMIAPDGITYTSASGVFPGSANLAAASGDASSVPEPEAWVMMVLGFGMVGSAVRSKRTPSSVFIRES